ncbi:E3 ubiquitin-protein ligase RFWD3 [Manihot esculenta]|uniref:Uncharacterized protein n=1 Tax=Manihot esculenta TaxID=3983 RepID=A0ACB7H401_MANES|nr:E3 ubiquitin-protein ligase RFWD3 [Manihot esculenta]KAG8647200.1 hypothetical protein MANES_09G065000v8 [Manihot esculenta]
MAQPYESDEENDAAFVYPGFEFEEETENHLESEEEEDDEEYIPVVNSPRVVGNVSLNPGRVSVEEERSKRRRAEHGGEGGGETCSLIADENAESSQGREWNRTQIDGLFCPICMDAWTSEGDHHISCLPCGHIFGLSCISRWLKQSRSSAKCPQCNRKCTLKDVRKLFAPRIAVIDEESQKTIRSLEVKCASLEKKSADWCRKESEWQKREAELQLKVNQLTERTTYLEHLVEDMQSRSNVPFTAGRNSQGHKIPGIINSKLCCRGSSSIFVLERELQVDGARLFDIDAFGQILLLVRRLPKIGGSHVLTKMNLLPPHESEDILLPSSMKIIKDLHISPFNGSHALCASLGEKLSVLSMESNSVILSYDLLGPAWSCCWDLHSSYYMYAGLQNGLLLAFDMRQTRGPVESSPGLTNNPIHTLYSVQSNSSSGVRTLLSASSIGICQWNFGSTEERPSLVPQTANQGVCISLAHCLSGDDVVVTFRPKVEMTNEMAYSQSSLTPCSISGRGVLGSHLHLKRVGDKYEQLGISCATVSNIQLPRSVIVDRENEKPLFAAGDEETLGLILQELPTFKFDQSLKSHKHHICDVKYTSTLTQGLLGCLSEDRLQLYSSKMR